MSIFEAHVVKVEDVGLGVFELLNDHLEFLIYRHGLL